MFWLGKLLGALFGYWIAGPFGAVAGILLGHYFDLARRGHWSFFPSEGSHSPNGYGSSNNYTKDIFFRATFTIMGYIAKSDGRVSENEIRSASIIMQNLRLSPVLRQRAINYFRQGKQANFDLDNILSLLRDAHHHQRAQLRIFFDIQLKVAHADGIIPRNKQKILNYISHRLGLNPQDFFYHTYDYAWSTYRSNPGYEYGTSSDYARSSEGRAHYNHNNHTHSGQSNGYRNYQRPSYQQKDLLADAYRELGVNASINNIELKKTYRKLMSKNHPDKLVSKGLSEEKIRLATQRTQEIKSAYERICKARGIR